MLVTVGLQRLNIKESLTGTASRTLLVSDCTRSVAIP